MTDPEKVEYKPITVRNALTEMKNLSEIMIDLAYSAALFNKQELAKEVLILEERVDYLTYVVNMNLMLATRDSRDAEALVGLSTVASATNEISDAAADIASIVLQDIRIHPVVREAFEQMEERLMRVEVKHSSILTEEKLGELDLAARIGMDIIAIRRGKQWIIDPKEHERIMSDDVLFARGAPRGVEKLHRLASGEKKELE